MNFLENFETLQSLRNNVLLPLISFGKTETLPALTMNRYLAVMLFIHLFFPKTGAVVPEPFIPDYNILPFQMAIKNYEPPYISVDEVLDETYDCLMYYIQLQYESHKEAEHGIPDPSARCFAPPELEQRGDKEFGTNEVTYYEVFHMLLGMNQFARAWRREGFVPSVIFTTIWHGGTDVETRTRGRMHGEEGMKSNNISSF